MAGLSMRKYAAYRKAKGLPGGSVRAVQKAVETARIALDPDGTIDPERADVEWEKNTNVSLRRNGPKLVSFPEQPALGPVVPPAGVQAGVEAGKKPPTLAEVTIEEKLVVTDIKRRELSKLDGKLLDAEEVEKTWSNILSRLRNNLLLLPDEIADRLAIENDSRVCRSIVYEEIRDALTVLSEYQLDAA